MNLKDKLTENIIHVVWKDSSSMGHSWTTKPLEELPELLIESYGKCVFVDEERITIVSTGESDYKQRLLQIKIPICSITQIDIMEIKK